MRYTNCLSLPITSSVILRFYLDDVMTTFILINPQSHGAAAYGTVFNVFLRLDRAIDCDFDQLATVWTNNLR